MKIRHTLVAHCGCQGEHPSPCRTRQSRKAWPVGRWRTSGRTPPWFSLAGHTIGVGCQNGVRRQHGFHPQTKGEKTREIHLRRSDDAAAETHQCVNYIGVGWGGGKVLISFIR